VQAASWRGIIWVCYLIYGAVSAFYLGRFFANNKETVVKSWNLVSVISLLIVMLGASDVVRAQGTDAQYDRFVQVRNGYRVNLNVTYRRANNWDGKLDIIRPRVSTTPNPTVVYFHGGGWTAGRKDGGLIDALPYLEMGWTVVNVAYRLADVSLAPAAVEDTRCALRWIYRNSEEYNFDLNRIVLTGSSAGGHLALITGMLTEDAGLDLGCPGDRGPGPQNIDPLKVAGIINWYGITDVADLIERTPGPSGNYTQAWLGTQANREEIAKRVSPLTYVRSGLPPVLIIHGDSDPTVPYEHALRLQQALESAGVAHELVTVEGGKHGGFTNDEYTGIYRKIRAFLSEHDLGPTMSN
jgi:acetyl esterase/lipase